MTEEKSNSDNAQEEVTISPPPVSNFGEALKQGDEIANRIKAENDRAEQILKQNQELMARQVLGGQTSSASPEPEQKEETPQDYAKKIMGGK